MTRWHSGRCISTTCQAIDYLPSALRGSTCTGVPDGLCTHARCVRSYCCVSSLIASCQPRTSARNTATTRIDLATCSYSKRARPARGCALRGVDPAHGPRCPPSPVALGAVSSPRSDRGDRVDGSSGGGSGCLPEPPPDSGAGCGWRWRWWGGRPPGGLGAATGPPVSTTSPPTSPRGAYNGIYANPRTLFPPRFPPGKILRGKTGT